MYVAQTVLLFHSLSEEKKKKEEKKGKLPASLSRSPKSNSLLAIKVIIDI